MLAVVGYYDMASGQGNPNQVAAITAAGHTAVLLTDLTSSSLAGIDVIDVQNPDNGNYGAEYLSRLTNIQNAVSAGAVLVIHDRYVDPAESILPGGASFNIVRDFTDDASIDVLDSTTLVTNGPGGIVSNTTLDGGTSSSHGFALSGSLPLTSKQILSTSNSTHIVTFSYTYGAGAVIYSSIPLDFYRSYSPASNFSTIYAPNVLAYAVSLTNTPPIAQANGPYSVNEGGAVTLSAGGSTDPDGSISQYEWDLDNDGSFETTGANPVFSAASYDGPSNRTVRLRVRDNQGAYSAVDTATVTVNNVAPQITALNVTPVINENGTATLTGAFTDPGVADVHTVTVDWADGSAPSVVTLPVGQRNFTLTHQYLDDGASPGNGTSSDSYVLTVSVADDDGGNSSQGGGSGSGAVIIDGGDRDDHGYFNGTANVNGWKFIEQMVDYAYNGAANGQTGILVAGASSTALAAINSAINTLGLPAATVVTGAALSSVNFDNYALLYIPSNNFNVAGGISGSDRSLLTARKVDIQNFINNGGSLVNLTDNGYALPYSWLTLPTQFTIGFSASDTQYQTQALINSGLTISNAELTNGTPLHNVFTGPAGFNGLTPFVYNVGSNGIPENGGGDDQVVTLGLATGSVGVGLNVTVNNVAPSNLSLNLSSTSISENGTVSLLGGFTDPGTLDVHTVTIDWGDGSAAQVVTLPAGVTSLNGISHQYLDDNPTGTSQDTYTISVSLADDDGGAANGGATVTVQNVAPSSLDINLSAASILENGAATLTGSFVDPGTQDPHTVTISWGDGSPNTVLNLAQGVTSIPATSHQYLDDDPTGTPQDSYTINVTITDDDGGSVATGSSGSVTITSLSGDIANSDFNNATSATFPTIIAQQVSFSSSSFAQAHSHGGPVDIAVEVHNPITNQWTAVYQQTLNYSSAQFFNGLTASFAAQPVDQIRLVSSPGQNQTYHSWNSFAITLQGSATAGIEIEVNNVAPVVTGFNVDSAVINEDGSVTVSGSFTDDGTLDKHSVLIDWGYGEISSAAVVVQGNGNGTFSATHQYLDDNPTASSSDLYTITATVTDDDTGSASSTVDVTVNNVAPVVTGFNVDSAVINEDGSVTVSGSFTDDGTLDKHSVLIDWGNGETSSPAVVVQGNGSGTFSATHQYLDDNPTASSSDLYTITATVTDDDTGSASSTVDVTVNNVAPVVTGFNVDSAVINEDGSVTVSGSFTDDGTLDKHSVLIDWGYGEISSAAVVVQGNGSGTFSATHQYLDDNPTASSSNLYTITATVTDDDTGSASSTVDVTVNNVAPVISSLSNTSPECGDATEGDAISLSVFFSDVGTLDSHTATIDWGDGNVTGAAIDQGAGTASGNHAYATGGIFTITITLTDDDGGTVTATSTAVISGVGVVGDVLYVIGTDADDHVTVNKAGNNYRVHADFLATGSFRDVPVAGISRMIVQVCDGDDQVTVSSGVSIQALVDGGAGHDKLNGGGGPNILIGGAGNDQLIGGSLRDILIGGAGSDRLVGNGGEDILVAGSTDHDAFDPSAHYSALWQLLDEWNDSTAQSVRVGHITGVSSGGLNGSVQLNTGTVDDDGAADKLTGSAGLDWFFANLSGGTLDSATDAGNSELLEELI